MPPSYIDNLKQYPSFDHRHYWMQQSQTSNANEPNRFGSVPPPARYYNRGISGQGLGISYPRTMSTVGGHFDDGSPQQYTPMQPVQYGPLQPGNASAYECHCAECTHFAETGWSTYINQGAFAPFPTQQATTLQAQSQYNFRDRYGYPPANPLWHGQPTISARLPSIDASGFTYDAPPPVNQEEPSMALIAPRDIFTNPTPATALSDCSTCSTNHSFSSSNYSGDMSTWQPYSMAPAGDPWSIRRSTDGWSNILQGGRDLRETTQCPSEQYSVTEPDDGSQYSPSAQASHDYTARHCQTSAAPEASPDTELSSSDDRDDLLVQWKLEGMSYKEIKARGRFREAESTLRGRFRALTKDPKQRVRKPHWTRRDLKLLREAVEKLSVPTPTYQTVPTRSHSRSSSPTHRVSKGQRRQQVIKLKTSWKEVADYIIEHGGTYRFGNATCRKKYDEVFGNEEEHTEE